MAVRVRVEEGDAAKKKKRRRKFVTSASLTERHSCVLLVGTTGTGKTSTANIYTGSELPTGSAAHSVTEITQVCRDSIHDNAPMWIDNPGVGCRHDCYLKRKAEVRHVFL